MNIGSLDGGKDGEHNGVGFVKIREIQVKYRYIMGKAWSDRLGQMAIW